MNSNVTAHTYDTLYIPQSPSSVAKLSKIDGPTELTADAITAGALIGVGGDSFGLSRGE